MTYKVIINLAIIEWGIVTIKRETSTCAMLRRILTIRTAFFALKPIKRYLADKIVKAIMTESNY